MPEQSAQNELAQAALLALNESLPQPVYVVDELGRFVDVVGGDERDAPGWLGHLAHEVMPREHADDLLRTVHTALREERVCVHEYRSDIPDAPPGSAPPPEQWYEARVAPLRLPISPRRATVLTINITERKRGELAAANPAVTDALTGLGNRDGFVHALEQKIREQARYDARFCLLLMKIDHLDVVVANEGRAVADACLIEVANTIQQQLRQSDELGRLGAAEFAVLLCQVAPAGAVEVAERLRQRIAGSVFGAPRLQLTVSAGLTECREGDTASAMLERAGAGVYRSQLTGCDRITGV